MKVQIYIVIITVMLSCMAVQAGLISWSGIQNIRYESLRNGEITPPWELDINDDGVLDYEFTPPSSMVVQPCNGAGHSPGPNSGGTLFNENTVWESVTAWELTSNHEPIGFSPSEDPAYWDNVNNKYFGTRIAVNGDFFYGWLQMSVSTDPDVPENNYVVFHDWAYQTEPGVGIVAGVVPEPSSIALMLCGGLAIIGMYCRKRR